MIPIPIEKEFPIIEFDADRNAFIRPENVFRPIEISENCVLCFFAEAIEKVLSEYPHRICAYFKAESFKPPIYELEYEGKKIALVQAGVGAPVAASQIDELAALGCKKFVACGSCGVLRDEIAVGRLIIPIAAVRDEGTSYHYVEPSREIFADEDVAERIEAFFVEKRIPYIKTKTWTTDAFYRETPAKIKLRKDEGCAVVEMEASAYMAVARYNGVAFGQILYAGDSLGGDEWDSRDYANRTEVRGFLLRTALDACLRI